MSQGTTQPGTGEAHAFLTVQQAADALGCSRIRVREAVARGLLVGRADNEGRLRIDLPEGLQAVPANGTPLEPDAVMSFLFDDIEDLEAALGERDTVIARLGSLAERQGQALDRADTALQEAEAQKARLSSALERALAHLEAAPGPASTERLTALLDRSMALAERGSGAEAATERALAMLDSALAQAEAGQAAQDKSNQMLERALSTGEQMRTELNATKEQLRAQDARLETALSMSERAVALANTQKTPRRRGLLGWLFGA